MKRLEDDGWYEVKQTGSHKNKTATTRLLDLLAGWSAYVSADEDNNLRDPVVSAEDIGALYQLAGELSEQWEVLSGQDQEKAIRAFLEERLLPVLVGTGPAG